MWDIYIYILYIGYKLWAKWVDFILSQKPDVVSSKREWDFVQELRL